MIPAALNHAVADALLKKERVLFGLDGMAGAGKSRLAVDLAEHFGGQLVKLDHFYLPASRRDGTGTPHVASHMDLARLKDDVLAPLRLGQPARYDIFACTTQRFEGSRQLKAAGLIIIEGSYALHPEVLPYYDLTVFLTVDTRVQNERLKAREGSYFDTFQREWLPREQTYHDVLNPAAAADFRLDLSDRRETVLYLVRHGVTEGNRTRMIQGHKDVHLSEDGREQARKLAARLQDHRFDQAFTSDLMRAAETAAIVLEKSMPPHETMLQPTPLLREIHMGDMEGLLYSECYEQYRETFDALKETPLDVITPGGETGADVLARARTFVHDALAASPDQVLLAVSHGYILNLLLQSHAKEAGLTLPPTVFKNTSLTKMVFENGILTDVPLLNDTRHLADATPAQAVAP